MQIYLIIILSIISCSTCKSFIFKNILPKNKLLNNINNDLFLDKPLYIIVSKKTKIVDKLIQDLDTLKINNIFLNIDYFSNEEIENLKNNYGYNIISNNVLVFQDNHFIGNIFDIYSRIYFL